MKITEKPFSIPDHWRWIELKELAEINPTFDRNDLSDDDPVSFVGMKRVEELSGRIDLSETEPLSEVRKGYTYFEDGDVLFAKITPCMENGKVAVARGLENGVGFGSTEFHVIRHPEEITQEWIFHYLIQEGFRRDAKRAMTGSAGQKRVPTGYIEEVPIPLPPLPEQRRIVAKIEELFSNLDAGMGDLQTAEQQLERYRLSVLQAAVEGRLTADWRETHDPEPADQLLERVLEERREQWEKHYRWSRYDSKGKEPPSGWKDRYDEREKPKMSDSPLELPESWTWASADQIGRVETGSTPKTSVDEYYGGEYPFYRPGDLEAGLNTAEAEKTLTEEGLKEARPLPEKSTLITCIGSIGKSGMIRRKGASNQQINAIIPTPSMVPEYIYFAVNSPHFQVLLEERASATTMSIINKGKTKTLPLPLPPLAEQKRIVDEVERLLSVANDASDTADREHTRAERLRQSILKQAFSGQLVPHDDGEAPSIPDTSTTVANGKDEQESRSPTTDGNATEERSADGDDLLDGIDESNQIEMDL